MRGQSNQAKLAWHKIIKPLLKDEKPPAGYVVCRHCGHTVKNRECTKVESKNCTAKHRETQ